MCVCVCEIAYKDVASYVIKTLINVSVIVLLVS